MKASKTMKTIVYAASDATLIEIDATKFLSPPDSFTRSGKVYHRLTPEYWAWFRHKFHVMEGALMRGKISEATFVEILNRISTLYNHALAHYGRAALKHAEATLDILDIKEYDSRLKCDSTQTKQPSLPMASPSKAPPPGTPSRHPRIVVSR